MLRHKYELAHRAGLPQSFSLMHGFLVGLFGLLQLTGIGNNYCIVSEAVERLWLCMPYLVTYCTCCRVLYCIITECSFTYETA